MYPFAIVVSHPEKQLGHVQVTSAIGALEQDRFVKPVMLKQPVLAKRARLDQGLTSQQGSVVDITVAQYYYVDWCEVTNIARLRIHKLQSRHEVRSCNIDPVGKYICTTPSCQAVYSPFQFAELYNSVQNNLVCPKCKCILVSSRTAAASSAHAYTMQMNAALGDVLACFAEVDGAVIAESAVVPIAPATSYWATVREEGREVARGNYAANRYYTVGGGEGAHAMAAHVATKEVAKIYPEWYATREGGKRGAHDMRRDSEESWASSIGEEGVCTDEGEDNFLDHRQSDPLEETGSTDHDVAALRMQEQTIMISGKLKRVCDLRQQDFVRRRGGGVGSKCRTDFIPITHSYASSHHRKQ